MTYNEIEHVKLLLSHPKIDINALEIEQNYKKSFHSEMSALAIAVEKGQENIVQLLLSHNEVDVNYRSFLENDKSKSYTPILHNAIIKGNYNIVKYLLSNPKIDVNQKSFYKNTNKEIIEIFEEPAINQAIISTLDSSDQITLIPFNDKAFVKQSSVKLDIVGKNKISQIIDNLNP